MGVRKNAVHLTPTERDNFLRAVLTLKNTIVNPADPPAQQISIYDQFAGIHLGTLSVNVPGGGGAINMGHQNSGFGPWHRYYLLRFEQALQAVDPTVNLPYWDWTDHTATATVLFQDNFLGPNGGVGGAGGGIVQSGYFAFDAPATGGNPPPLPPWWPAGLVGWRIRASLQQGHGAALQRSLQPFANLATQANMLTTLGKTDYEGPPAASFRQALEAGTKMHNFHHGWVGGQMGDPLASPNDLIFFLHHCNIDRLWAMWQINVHQGAAFYPAAGRPSGHNLNDPMWPWVGALAGYSSNFLPADVVLPNFAVEPIRHPADMLNHRALGYSYDIEAIVGIALDQTGSMVGMTPDPLTGMPPNISKWNAAKQGVSFLLHDAETAFSSGEAYVTVGVETLRTLGANTFTNIFPGTPYGLIKSGSPYSQATFDANIVAQSPGGGTPLAGALTDTDTNLVRAPFANQPAGEQRYLVILTDGKETALPLLNTLATPQFPNTVIFGMGFGVGGGWDGVDYATIADMTTKGKAAPGGVGQVFHGENAGAIDKFYTNSIAAAIGYTPTIDPIFDLYPGEEIHVPFDILDADQSYMITALGFDFEDKNWDFCLMMPDGTHCADTSAAVPDIAGHFHSALPIGHSHGTSAAPLVTMKKKNGRCTMFLNRNGADCSAWVGRWHVMASYQVEHGNGAIVMPAISNLIFPVGAPPVRGPLYTRHNQPAIERRPVRAMAGAAAHTLALPLSGRGTTDEDGACAVSINIYNRTTVQATLSANLTAGYAGEDFELELRLEDRAGATITPTVVAARLVAPAHSIGNAFADLRTISLQARRKYVNPDNPRAPFDEVAYLADYERLRPGAFPIRDEAIVFTLGNDGIWRARVKGNRYPGIYRVAVYIAGSYDRGEHEHDDHCCVAGPQHFSRVLSTEVALGIRHDERSSKPTLHWLTSNRLLITLTPTDALGNSAAPANATAPVVIVNGNAVVGRLINPYTGEHQVEVKLIGQGFQLDKYGQTITGGQASIETRTGDRLVLEPDKAIMIEVGVDKVELPVLLPQFIGDQRSRKAFPAGLSEALSIPLRSREVFASEREARDAGYELVG